jgi:NAD(P)-dependent dehydrogenase (short-subunit alcohol dehydrogenase family)
MLAYGQSKTANVLFAVEAARRWASDGITANAVHPGAVMESNSRATSTPTSSRPPSRQQDMSTRLASKAPPRVS